MNKTRTCELKTRDFLCVLACKKCNHSVMHMRLQQVGLPDLPLYQEIMAEAAAANVARLKPAAGPGRPRAGMQQAFKVGICPCVSPPHITTFTAFVGSVPVDYLAVLNGAACTFQLVLRT
eukprot:1149923-Pelagomonas_calceolata.AAC.3